VEALNPIHWLSVITSNHSLLTVTPLLDVISKARCKPDGLTHAPNSIGTLGQPRELGFRSSGPVYLNDLPRLRSPVDDTKIAKDRLCFSTI
jgi:hypothetical protein